MLTGHESRLQPREFLLERLMASPRLVDMAGAELKRLCGCIHNVCPTQLCKHLFLPENTSANAEKTN
ncbi:hypothetical protein BK669_20095 [Pseudomonas fluorescens]|nr:hypothetical protein BK669_20095 [Pseudomonas fluorescens]